MSDRPGPPKRFFSDELHAKAWPKILAHRRMRRVVLGAVLIGTMVLDYVTGPTIRFPSLYAIPILLTSWYEDYVLGFSCGALVVIARFLMESHFWQNVPWTAHVSFTNAVTSLFLLAIISWFTAMAGRLSRHVRILWGLVPICMDCHRIRNEKNTWMKLEAYITERSQARFSHGLCPDCAATRTP